MRLLYQPACPRHVARMRHAVRHRQRRRQGAPAGGGIHHNPGAIQTRCNESRMLGFQNIVFLPAISSSMNPSVPGHGNAPVPPDHRQLARDEIR